jgi:tripartite-type tricarboxylate transporter receptor subunit TctC
MRFIRNFAPLFAGALAASLGLGSAPAAVAASGDYPNRPIRLIIPNATGAAVDTLGRISPTR